MNEQRVTLVTRNKEHALTRTLVELAVYGAVLYFVVNPEQLESVTDNIARWRKAITHRVSIWQAQNAIRSLPETE